MTSEMEKQFFDTFGIEPKMDYLCPKCNAPMYKIWRSDDCGYICTHETHTDYELKHETEIKDYKKAYRYPQITDRHYLELYCTLCDAFDVLHVDRHPAFTFRVKDFKECVLKDLIMVNTFYESEYVKHKVQQLFSPNP